jgi:hypothetical protein
VWLYGHTSNERDSILVGGIEFVGSNSNHQNMSIGTYESTNSVKLGFADHAQKQIRSNDQKNKEMLASLVQ